MSDKVYRAFPCKTETLYGLFTLTHCIVDECEMDEAKEQRIEFLEA